MADLTDEDYPAIAPCPACYGSGEVADYIGFEMKAVGVPCDKCGGTGILTAAVAEYEKRRAKR